MAADVFYDLCKLTPSDVSIDVVGGAIEGGRSLSGVTQSIDYSGGGFVAVTYGGINCQDRGKAKEWNRLAAALNGSVRTVEIPLWTDQVAARDGSGVIAGSPGSGIADPTLNSAPLGATALIIHPSGGVTLDGGEWFSIAHGGAIGKRAYRIWEAIASGGAYNIKIMPPLREAIAAATPASFYRPECQMRLPAGETMAWAFHAPGATSELSVNFVEAF